MRRWCASFILAVGALSALSMSNCSGVTIVADTSPVYAMEANDATVIIAGCGNQPVVGYTYCRVHEGQDTTKFVVSLMAPPVKCKTKPCVTFKVFFPQGQPAWGVSVPDGATQVNVTWQQLLGAPLFVKDSQGFWQVVMEWNWLDGNGNEHQSAALGEIRLRVLDANYTALNGVHDDKNFGWHWASGAYHLAFSTAGRATVYGGAIP